MPAALLVLGMHRSGTSCLAGLLAAAGARPPGPVVRNWDNRLGHHEAVAAVRLSEAVLAASGGSWIAPPPACTWDAAQAAARDRLLAGSAPPALLKDPRMLLCLPFWLGGPPLRAIGIVRHPLAVARSLLAWRRLAVEDGLRLWLAHNRALAALRAGRRLAVLDFDAPRAAFLAAAGAAIAALAPELDPDPERLAAAYDPGQVHHDGGGGAPAGGDPGLLADCLDLHRALGGGAAAGPARFPWRAWEALRAACAAGDAEAARQAVHAAAAGAADPGAILAPACAELLRAGLAGVAAAAVAAADLDPRLRGLLLGKAALAQGDAAAARSALAAACAVPQPFWEARRLHAEALRRAGDAAGARAALAALAAEAVHPHEVLAALAEWERADGLAAAAATMARALAAAPAHRRGRLAARLGEWLLADGDPGSAAAVLRQGLADDPAYPRQAAVLARCLSGPARGRAPRRRPAPPPTGP